jgi:hypothetical protein
LLKFKVKPIKHAYAAILNAVKTKTAFALFAIYGTGVLIIGLFRRSQGNRQFFSEIGEDGIHRHKILDMVAGSRATTQKVPYHLLKFKVKPIKHAYAAIPPSAKDSAPDHGIWVTIFGAYGSGHRCAATDAYSWLQGY